MCVAIPGVIPSSFVRCWWPSSVPSPRSMALKHLIDIVAGGPGKDGRVWSAFALLCALVAADNLLWRIAGWAAAYTFVAVTGDIRRDLFGHLSGHSPSYFAERLPGALASRITATANATFITENTGSWNVLPPCVSVVCADHLHRFGQHNDGRSAGRRGGGARCTGIPPRAPRDAAAPQLRLQGGGGGWRTGGRDRQHGRGAGVRCHVSRAEAHRRHDRRRDGRPPRQPVSIWKGCA